MISSVRDALEEVEAKLGAYAPKFTSISYSIGLILHGENGGKWRVKVSVAPEVVVGEGRSDCSIELAAQDFISIVRRELNPQVAFMLGEVKLSGNTSILFDIVGKVLDSSEQNG